MALLTIVTALAPTLAAPAGGQLADLPRITTTAPDGTPAVELDSPLEVTLPATAFGDTGTLELWVKLPETLRSGDRLVQLLAGDVVDLSIRERANLIHIPFVFGPRMAAEGVRPTPQVRGLVTHLDAGRWYHLAFTWNGAEPDNHFLLDGLDQGTPEPQADPGTIHAASGDGPVTLRLGQPGVTLSAPRVHHRALSADEVRARLDEAGHAPYLDEGVRITDEKLSSHLIADKHLVYSNDFDNPGDLDDWVREGGESATIVDGHLRLTAGPSAAEGRHIVYWLKQQLPADFLAEWQFRPADKREGLTIVFFNARGIGGESIFDPSLAPRDGDFKQYHSGDLDSYHISYWAGTRGSVNLRKNQGFALAAIGRDTIHDRPRETFDTVTLLKRGGRIRLAVNGEVVLTYNDNGETYGPVHNHAGWFGLRQMAHSWYTEYDGLRIWGLD